MKESNIQKLIQLACSDHGIITFRNNIGAYKTPEGYMVRYGVGGNGGSDLIGISPVKITESHIGMTLGVFTAFEIKTQKGKPTNEQINFINVINNNGGIAGICRSTDDLLKLIKKY